MIITRIARLTLVALLLGATPAPPARVAPAAPCATPLSIPGVRLKDHSLFAFDGFFYLVAIRIDLPNTDGRGELSFAYARTHDFCAWEELAAPLRHGDPGDPDEAYIWAPHVIAVGDTFYMYYTGVNRQIAQTIMLATSTNPADPQSWQKQGAVFRPHHPDAVYPGPQAWSDCRDPMVLAHQGRYYLYYTGANRAGPIVGLAVADAPAGPWYDLGAVYAAAEPGRLPESPYVVEQAGLFYLFYNASGPGASGTRWRWSTSPFGPWQPAVDQPRGWAYDFFRADQGWLATYLLGNGEAIAIAPIRWRGAGLHAWPQIGERIYLPIGL